MDRIVPFIPYGKQNITDEDIQAVVDVLKSDLLTQGPKIQEFERAFADYVGAKYAVAVNNATAGLHLSSKVLGAKINDRVIVTPITFAASANCIRYCGGDVVFCDIDKHSYLLDMSLLRKKLASSPPNTYQGIVAVDFAGYPINLEELKSIADDYGLWILEDACHALGDYFIDSKGETQYCGNGKFADIAVFSFHPVKHITTGEGGMITTNNDLLYEKICLYRTHGIIRTPTIMSEKGGWYNEMIDLGYNYRLTDFQAALGISQLKRAKVSLLHRKRIAQKYDQAFKSIKGIVTPHVVDGYYHAYHLYVIQVEDRRGMYDFLRKNNIFTQVHYVPLHWMPYYRNINNVDGLLPTSEAYYQHCLSLPMFPALTNDEQDFVIQKILEFLR